MTADELIKTIQIELQRSTSTMYQQINKVIAQYLSGDICDHDWSAMHDGQQWQWVCTLCQAKSRV